MDAHGRTTARTARSPRTRPMRSPQALRTAFAVALGAGVLLHGGHRPADPAASDGGTSGGIALVSVETSDDPDSSPGDSAGSETSSTDADSSSTSSSGSGGDEPTSSGSTGSDEHRAEDTAAREGSGNGDSSETASEATTAAGTGSDGADGSGTAATPSVPETTPTVATEPGTSGPATPEPAPPLADDPGAAPPSPTLGDAATAPTPSPSGATVPAIPGAVLPGNETDASSVADVPRANPNPNDTGDPLGGPVERVVDEVAAALTGPVARGAAALAGLAGLGPGGPAEPAPAAALLLAAMARRGQGTLTNGPSAARRGQVGEASTGMALAGAAESATGSVTTTFPGSLHEVVTGADGTTLYVVSRDYDAATRTQTTYVSIVDTTDPDATPSTVVVPGYPHQILPGADGTVTVVSSVEDRAAGTTTTHVTVIDPAHLEADPVTTTARGIPYRIVRGADGALTVVSYDYVYDSTTETNRDYTTYVTTSDPANPEAEPNVVTLVGSPSAVVTGPDGVITVVTGEYDAATRVSTTHITVVDPARPEAPPVTRDLSGYQREILAGPGGTVVVATNSYDAATGTSTTHLAAVDPTDPTAPPVTTTVPGSLVRIEPRPDGTTAVVTYDYGASTTHVAFVDLADPAGPRTEVALSGYVQSIGPGADGTTVIVTEQRDYVADTTTTHVAFVDPGDPAATPVVVTLPGRLNRIEPGPDGRALVLTRAYGGATPFTTQIALVDPRDADATPVVAELPGWNPEIVHRDDGTLAVVSAHYDPAADSSTTHVAVLDPDEPDATISELPGVPYRIYTADSEVVPFLYEYDVATGTSRLTPVDLTDPAPNPAGTATLRGRVSDVRPNSDGTFTVLTREYDQATRAEITHIAVVDPADPADTRIVGDVPGSEHRIVQGPGGVLTIVSYSYDSGEYGDVHVAVVDPTQPNRALVVTPLPGELSRVETGADGTVTVVTLVENVAGSEYTTHITVIDPSDADAAPTVSTVPGRTWAVIDGIDGTRYAFVYDYASQTTTVVTVGPAGSDAAADRVTFPGYLGQLHPGPNGTSYLTATTYDPETQTSRSDVFLFDPVSGGPTITPLTAGIPGSPQQLTVDPDGVLTAISYDDGSTYITVVDTTDPGARPFTTSLPGYADSYSTDTDGVLTVTTVDYDEATGAYTTHIAVVDTADPTAIPATAAIPGYWYSIETVVSGPDRTRYVVSRGYDPATGTESTLLTLLTVLRVLPNQPPAPGDGPVVGQPGEDGAVVVDPGVSDPNGDALEVAVDPADAPDPALGAVTVNPDGTVTYTPTAEARHDAARAAALGTGPVTDTFTVLVSDGRGGQVPVVVTVTIAPGNATPAAPVGPLPGPVTDRRRGGRVTGQVGLSDADGDELAYSVDDEAEHGAVSVDATGTWTYTPTEAARAAAATGGPTTDSFTLTVDDGHGGRVTVPITVDISPNQAPIDGVAPEPEADPGTGVVTGSVGVTDPDDQPLEFSVGTDPSNGTVVIDPVTGQYVYTPTPEARHAAAAETGPASGARVARLAAVGGLTTDTFVVDVVDDGGLHTFVTVTVPIAPLNTDPAAPATPSTPTTNAATGAVSGDLGVTDADGDTLGYALGTEPDHGTAAVDPVTGRWTYTPTDAARRAAAAGGPVTDTFALLVSDGHGGLVEVPVTVAISPPAPTIPPVPTTPTPPRPGHPKPRPCPPGKDHTAPAQHDGVRTHRQDESRHHHDQRRWLIDLVHHRAALVPAASRATSSGDHCRTVQVYGLDGRYLWVLDQATGAVKVIDTRSERVVARISVGAGAVGLAMSADGTQLTVSHANGHDTVIDTATRAALDGALSG